MRSTSVFVVKTKPKRKVKVFVSLATGSMAIEEAEGYTLIQWKETT